MAAKNITVFGIYDDQQKAEYAVDALRADGFQSMDISVLLPSRQGTEAFAKEKHVMAAQGTAEGAAAGAGTGGVVGGVLGWLAGLGLLAIPGLGPFIAAGPIMGLLAGAGIGGAAGTVTGALIGLGVSEAEAKRYEELIKNGGVLVSVHTDDSALSSKGKALLQRTGAKEVSTNSDLAAGAARAEQAAQRARVV